MKYHLFDWESLRFEKYCHILTENHRSAVFDGKGNDMVYSLMKKDCNALVKTKQKES